MKKIVYSIASVAVTATSVALLAGYTVKKKKTDEANLGMLVAGIAGLFVGAAIALEPTRQAAKGLVMEGDVMTEDDVDLMHENISEVLGTGAADRGKKAENLRQIELDEEASIEDFMN